MSHPEFLGWLMLFLGPYRACPVHRRGDQFYKMILNRSFLFFIDD